MGKVYGLHFGLNKSRYDTFSKARDLRHAENDAIAYHAICESLGYESGVFLARNATISNFTENLNNFAKKCTSGDLLVLSFSGHGSRVKDINKDEEDQYDEILVFYDKMILDDQIKVQFSKFDVGSNILYITDCCYSGTVSRFRLESNALKISDTDHIERGFDSDIAQGVFNSTDEYIKIKSNINERDVKVRSSIIHIAACQDDEKSWDGSVVMKHGLLTHRLLRTWDNGIFEGDHQLFFNKIAEKMGGNQNPKLSYEGLINESFKKSKPFHEITSKVDA